MRSLYSREPGVSLGEIADGSLRTIPSSPADAPGHGPDTVAAVPATRHRGAIGRVLEIGVGSGLNLPLYSDGVEEVIGIDISPQLLVMAERAAVVQSQLRRLRVRLLEASAESVPSTIADGSVDTVVVTWALCSIPNVGRLSPRPIVCSAAVGRFASSSTDDRPMPRWPGGRTASPRCGNAARAAVISIGKPIIFCDRQASG